MVSFWPWKGDTSAASFEKTLSTLATKISKTAAKNDSLRQNSRRVRLMWSLYAGFAYILTVLILVLVTGWRSWGMVEYSVVAGAPLLIYSIRRSLTAYYEYRISKTQVYLEDLYKERDTTIQRLKEATKYDSTQQLLEKYGSPPKTPKSSSPSANRRKSQGPQKAGGEQPTRTNLPLPPTANIVRNQGPQLSTPQRPPSASSPPVSPPQPLIDLISEPLPGAEFAPNAFAPSDLPRQYSAASAATYTQHNWYDRILDVLLGEDETQPKNRLALICDSCRLVNGQAPPGTRSLENVGRWRCGGCGAWNGKEVAPDVGGLVESWEAERRARGEDGYMSSEHGEISARGRTGKDGSSEEEEVHTDEGSGDSIVNELVTSPPPAQSTRSKSKGQGKKKS
ncbi:hypothetical protein AOQ84DRAFT_325274 [Glonium stellatum]|uniref:Endoplasmic reticulum junction formation protein lunapark n=1 Tax=Glonium stellatum TaxID=574774 RepID=A0A8E2ESL6_9PEZI|nr:hypothetical protein AOQ84DRAFT_325274 [Glonium stellatum]